MLFLLAVGLVWPLDSLSQSWHTTPDRWSEPRIFHSPYLPRYDFRIVFDKVAVDVPEEGRLYSWFYVKEPNTLRDGPWTTEIFVSNERKEITHISLIDHKDYERRVEWINEKLIYVSIWWGRVLGTYFIYDVESEKVIIKEMMNDGTIPHMQWKGQRTKS